MWMLVALAGFVICLLNRSINRDFHLIRVPSITYALLFMILVVMVTAYSNGGIGANIFGSSKFGGRRYFYTILAVIGYLVLISRRIPPRRAILFTSLFFLSALTTLVPDLIGLAGSKSSILYELFPPDFTAVMAAAGETDQDFFRVLGLTFSSIGIFSAQLACYGLRGVFDLSKPWRAGIFLLALGACIYSGFRSFFVLMGLMFVIQFFTEGLHRTRLLPVLACVTLTCGLLLLPQVERLPLVVQRTLSVLNVRVSPLAKDNAQASSEWRLRMWKAVLPEVPGHLLLGKGYSMDPTAMYFSWGGRQLSDFDWAVVSGDYHNGPLSLVMPFGIWGIIAFAWFCTASLRYLYRNYRSGPAELSQLNTFLFACFIARLIYFLFVFGGFFGDLFYFTGLVGLSVSLNGPEPVKETQPEVEILEEELAERAYRDDYA
jgi:hypothetical protein